MLSRSVNSWGIVRQYHLCYNVRMKKRAFKPPTVVRNLKDDYDLEADINVQFWKNPSQEVTIGLMRIIGMSGSGDEQATPEEFEELDNLYFEYMSLLIIDTDIEGISFDTPEQAREAHFAKFLDWGIFFQAAIMYLNELTNDYENLKKLLDRVARLSTSGTSNGEQEKELVPTS